LVSVISDILAAGAKTILRVDPPLNLQEINLDPVEVMIDGGVPQHLPNGRMRGGGLRHQRWEKKQAKCCIFHSGIVASD
jgi:hypothetical protein